jgi:hypothetical protein
MGIAVDRPHEWRRSQEGAAWSKHTQSLGGRAGGIWHVLQDLKHHGAVEASVGEGEACHITLDGRTVHGREIDPDPPGVRLPRGIMRGGSAATHIEDPAVQ